MPPWNGKRKGIREEPINLLVGWTSEFRCGEAMCLMEGKEICNSL